MSVLLIAETFKEPGVAAEIAMPTATSPTAPAAPISATNGRHFLLVLKLQKKREDKKKERS